MEVGNTIQPGVLLAKIKSSNLFSQNHWFLMLKRTRQVKRVGPAQTTQTRPTQPTGRVPVRLAATLLHLPRHERPVRAAGVRHQLLMRALLHNAAVTHNGDEVSVEDRG
jgi:hypothetical protein